MVKGEPPLAFDASEGFASPGAMARLAGSAPAAPGLLGAICPATCKLVG